MKVPATFTSFTTTASCGHHRKLRLPPQVELKPGVGPVFDQPLVTPADVENLVVPDVRTSLK